MSTTSTTLIPQTKAHIRLGIAYQTLRNRQARGEFPLKSVKVGRCRYFRESDIEQYINSLFDSQEAKSAHEKLTEKRGRGRPRKSASTK